MRSARCWATTSVFHEENKRDRWASQGTVLAPRMVSSVQPFPIITVRDSPALTRRVSEGFRVGPRLGVGLVQQNHARLCRLQPSSCLGENQRQMPTLPIRGLSSYCDSRQRLDSTGGELDLEVQRVVNVRNDLPSDTRAACDKLRK